MEGWLMKKGWFNSWKMRFVICSDRTLSIFKSKGEKTGNSFNIIDCTIKEIDHKRWNRKFVFRVKIARKRMYFAAEDENSMNKWIASIQGRVQRASLLGANFRRTSGIQRRRSSPMVSLSRPDMDVFQIQKFTNVFFEASIKPDDPQAQFAFAEVCGEFLSYTHSQSMELFAAQTLPNSDIVKIEFLNSPSERKNRLKIMKNLAAIVEKRIPNVFVPLQCVIDFCGKSLFFETKISGTTSLTPLNADVLSRIGGSLDTLGYVQDIKGKVWVNKAEGLFSTASKNDIEKYIKMIDKMQVPVFDSQSLTDSLKTYKIPISKLPELAEMTCIPSIRVLIQIEMIARSAKSIFHEKIIRSEPLERNNEVVKFFNLILGTSDDANRFWNTVLTPRIVEKFRIRLDRNIPLLHLPQLFFSLQYHTGADFADTDKYVFESPSPLTVENLLSLNAVPHHNLLEISSSLRLLKKDANLLLSDSHYGDAIIVLNNAVSMYQSIFGDENIYVASGLAKLSASYCGSGDNEKALLCAQGALGAGRKFHCSLIPAYISQILSSPVEQINDLQKQAQAIIAFQLGSFHWLSSDVMVATANAYQSSGNYKEGLKHSQGAVAAVESLLGSDHPKTAKCILLQGIIQRMLGQNASAEPLIEQSLFAMTAAYGENSPQVAECLFELADVLLESGKVETALVSSLKSFEIRENVYDFESTPVIDSVQQLAIIYDALNQADNAFDYYKRLLNFLKRLEEEAVLEETIKVIRNVLCLFFRSVGSQNRQLIAQLRRRQIMDIEQKMSTTFQQLIENEPIDFSNKLLSAYQKSGDANAYDTLTALYHIAFDEISSFTWIEPR